MDRNDGNTICPNCELKAKLELDEAMNSYGLISVDEFLDNRIKAVNNLMSSKNNLSLRETSKIIFNSDLLSIIYSVSCMKCDFKYTYTHTENTKELLIMDKLQK